MNIAAKYGKSYFMPPEVTYDWVKKDSIEKPPIWCSVDLRDGNQALIEPMGLEEKLEFFRMLVDIVDTVEDTDLKLQAQPLAIISYILWWMGDERAMLAAMRALAIDEECSLAAIVAAAIHGDRWPNRN